MTSTDLSSSHSVSAVAFPPSSEGGTSKGHPKVVVQLQDMKDNTTTADDDNTSYSQLEQSQQSLEASVSSLSSMGLKHKYASPIGAKGHRSLSDSASLDSSKSSIIMEVKYRKKEAAHINLSPSSRQSRGFVSGKSSYDATFEGAYEETTTFVEEEEGDETEEEGLAPWEDLVQKDGAPARRPERRPTLDEDEILKLDVVDSEDEDYSSSSSSEEDEDENDESSKESYHGDKVTSLVNTSQQSNSVSSEHRPPSRQALDPSSFSASYGSFTLDGDASLSSTDTFQNSDTFSNSLTVPKAEKNRKVPCHPDIKAQPERSILKMKEEEEPRRGRRKHYSSDEDSRSSTSHSSSKAMSHSSCYSGSLNSVPASSGRRLRGYESADSGNVSIPTISDMGEDPDDRSLPSDPPLYLSGDSSSHSHMMSLSSRSSIEQHSGSSSILEESSLADDPTKSKDPSKFSTNQYSVGLKQLKPNSSWTSSGEWSSPRTASDHWASQENWSEKHGDLAAWTSGDEDDSSSDEQQEKEKSPIAKKRGKRQDQQQQPRSAYDKNAPWYCGDDDDDAVLGKSINSDTSSVLSNLRQKKKPAAPAAPKSTPLDQSMSFSDLVHPKSMSLSDLQKPKSMSLSDIQKPRSNARQSITMDDLPQDLPEESLRSMSLSDLLKDPSQRQSRNKGPITDPDVNQDRQAPLDDDTDETDEDERDDVSPEKEKGVDLVKDVLASPLMRRLLYAGLAIFLLFDIVLLIVLATRNAGGGNNPQVLASVPKTICGGWIPGQDLSELCAPKESEFGGGVANLVAKAIHATSPQPVELSLIPAGVTQGDIPSGDFTREMARSVLNEESTRLLRHRKLEEVSFVILQATGSQILHVLEQSLHDALVQGQGASYPYASGLRYSVDSTASFPSRIVAPIIIIDDVWGALQGNEKYSMITTANWATQYLKLQGEPTDLTPLTALTEYAKQTKVLETPEFSTREFIRNPELMATSGGIAGGNDGNSIATVERDICLDWVPGQGLSNVCSKEETSSQGGGVCNLVAWGLLSELQDYGKDTEIVLLNAAECQTDILQGFFEEREVKALLPFSHEVSLLTLTGELLVLVLEQAIDFVLESAANVGSYPYAGGLRFAVDTNAAFGKRISQVKWFFRGRWKSISLARTYSIATTSPLAEGDDGYTGLADAIRRVDTDLLIRDVFVDYAKAAGTLENPPLDSYSTQEYLQ
jgi:hypothetical protein